MNFQLSVFLFLGLVALFHGTQAETFYTENGEQIEIEVKSGVPGKPLSPLVLNTSYSLYDQDSRESPKTILPWNASYASRPSLFKQTDKIKIILHGFSQNATTEWVQKLKNILLDKGDKNTKVLLVNWTKGAEEGSLLTMVQSFLQTANNVFVEGQTLAASISRMASAYKIPAKNIHIIGQSAGAQVLGQAIKHLYEKHNYKLSRASCLDCAETVIGWAGVQPNKTHVHFMEAIHTSSSKIALDVVTGSFGVYGAYADVDLYPNEGKVVQPACFGNLNIFCSHNQADVYYIDLVERCDKTHDFEGHICTDEAMATSKLCTGDTVKVCSLLNSESRKEQHGNKSIIINFTTGKGELSIQPISNIRS